ncbi:aminotransferase class V-fold PLP-dependent enzyme [Octadecabacter sp.]|nr:aminotransferase class V-fold PLP-dependent enzyme [Octadecabacter sp.]
MINQYEPTLSADLNKKMDKYLTSGGWLTEFKETQAFEERIKSEANTEHAIAVTNGTTAIELMLQAVKDGIRDEVLIPNFTMAATAMACHSVGLKPVCVPVSFPSLTMCPETMADFVTEKTLAVIFMPANGRSGTLFDIRQQIETINKRRSKPIRFLMDGAQALGSQTPCDQKILSLAEISTTSFSMPKIITTGQGGMVLTDSEDSAMKIKKLKDFGRSRGGMDIHDEYGTNCKFTDVQAVIGSSQMENIEWRKNRKREIYRKYRDAFSDRLLPMSHNEVPWFYELLTPNSEELINQLKHVGISSRKMYPSLHKQKFMNQNISCDTTKKIDLEGVWLPSHLNLTDVMIEEVIENVKNAVS